MSRDEQRVTDYLAHILEAIEQINSYIEDIDEVGFRNSRLVQDAVIRNLEIIGEASKNIAKHHPDFALTHADVNLASAYEMRNALAHGLTGISRSTSKSSGRRSKTTCQTSTSRFNPP